MPAESSADEPSSVDPQRESSGGNVVVVGGSAGSLDALTELAAGLYEDFPAPILIAVHLREGRASALAPILDRAGPLAARTAGDLDPLEPGTILVAPPDRHLLVETDRVRVVPGPRVNGYRPSVDVLFHSAARSYGPGAVGVVLSGVLTDGSLGLLAIERRGGRAVVQADPLHEGMTRSALAHVRADAVAPAREIPAALTMLLRTREDKMAGPPGTESELEARFDVGRTFQVPVAALTCPECGGALLELDDGDAKAFACHVGHVFSSESVLAEQGASVERALWGAVRILNERAALLTRVAERTAAAGGAKSAARFERESAEAAEHAQVIKSVLERMPDMDAGVDRAA